MMTLRGREGCSPSSKDLTVPIVSLRIHLCFIRQNVGAEAREKVDSCPMISGGTLFYYNMAKTNNKLEQEEE